MFQRFSVLAVSVLLLSLSTHSQDLASRLDVALKQLATDKQFSHAIVSLYVVDGKTGAIIFDKNSQTGLSPASCQKVVTSASAFEILGKQFRFKTLIGHNQKIQNGVLQGDLYITGLGDPTFGSDRWSITSDAAILKKVLDALRKNHIRMIDGDLVCDDTQFTNNPVPTGWVWEDIGNYYGAGAWGLNWIENQFDIKFKTGNQQYAPTSVIATKPALILKQYSFTNFVTTGSKGSGDNAYLFSSPFHKNIVARGTVPMSPTGFTISGAVPDPPGLFITTLKNYLADNGIAVNGTAFSNSQQQLNNQATGQQELAADSIVNTDW